MQHSTTGTRFYFRERWSLLLAVALVGFIALLSLRSWLALGKQTEELATTQKIVAGTNGLLSTLKDAETGQRGFLLTGEVRYLDPYDASVLGLPRKLEDLQKTARARPDQARRVVQLKILVKQKLDELAETIVLARNGRSREALDIVRTDRGRVLMDQIRVVCAEIDFFANDNLARFTEESRSSQTRLGVTATLGSAVLCVLLIIATLAIQRGMKRRQQLIEDLQKTERRYRESRDWLDATLRSIGDGVIVTDTAARILFLNPVAAALTGWGQDDATGLPIEKIFTISNEETGAAVENPARAALRDGRVVGLANHTILTAKDGRRTCIDDSAGPIRDATGAISGVVLVFRDISERRRAELELKQSAEHIELLLNANPIGVINADLQGGVQYANDAFLSIIGYTRDDFNKGLVNWKAITPAEWLAFDAKGILEAKEKGVCSPYEKEYVRKDGSRVCVYVGYALLGEDREQAVAFILDLTDRKRAEEQFTRHLRRLVESNIVGIVVANQERIIHANELYLKMLGYSREDLLAGRVDWVRATPQKWLSKDMAALQELRETGVCTAFEKEYIKPDGTRVPVLMGAAALANEPDLTWIGFVVDLTAQKALERELILANERLSTVNQELESFAYAVSHDLQSPLRNVSSITGLLSRQLHQQLDAESKRLISLIQASAKQMNALIAGLLEYSKLTSTSLEPEPVDCAALIAATAASMEIQLAEAGAQLTCDALPAVLAGDQLSRVFQNLIDNALKYRADRAPVIRVTACRSDNEWILSVNDNGIGFDMQYADRIFGVFQRLHGSTRYPGTGIGLSICKRIVERYGGRMWVESTPGVGSTFYFSLRAAAEPVNGTVLKAGTRTADAVAS